jgi:Family of unknown function (DUF6275)
MTKHMLPEYRFVLGQEMEEAVRLAIGKATVPGFLFTDAEQLGEELMGIIMQFAQLYRAGVSSSEKDTKLVWPARRGWSNPNGLMLAWFANAIETGRMEKRVVTETEPNILNLPIQEQAKYHVFMYIKAHLEKTDAHVKFTNDDVYVVWFCKTLQNWKALVSSTLSDGMYYEVTRNGDKGETYIDAYKKFENVKVED